MAQNKLKLADVSTSTGTGDFVFATSPSLITPALGTPASGNLTNCTFPTLNQNTTGSAATLTTARAIYGNNFDGSSDLTQVIASTYGGTGNGFTKISGPTTTEKTITIPDANMTITAAAATVLDDNTVSDMVNTLGGATSTGTGGLVRATSPTLVTPLLGTPTSGVLTNCTGTATGLTSGITNALKSATTTVDVSSATAPSSGQVLTATSSTAATWQTPSSGGFTSQVKAYLGSNQTISTGFASRATLILDTESYDTGSEFDTGTYTFTAAATGYYQVCATLNWSSWVANSGFEFYMVIATVEKLMYNLDMNNGTGAWAFNYSQVIKLSATNTISFKAAQYTGSNKTLTGGDYSSWVTITRIG